MEGKGEGGQGSTGCLLGGAQFSQAGASRRSPGQCTSSNTAQEQLGTLAKRSAGAGRIPEASEEEHGAWNRTPERDA